MAIDGDDGQRIRINTGGTGIAGIQPARSPGTPNYSGLAGAWDQAAAGADAVFDIAAKALRSKRQQQAKTEGAKYGGRRKGGQAVPLTGLDGLDPNTVYGQQFIASATQAYGESVGLDARAKAYELQAQHAGDPEGFAASYGAFADESLAGLDEDTRAVVEPEFQAQMRLGHARLMRDKIVQARQDTVETLNASFEEKVGETLSLIRAGQGDDPRVAQLIEEAQTHYDAAMAENLVPEPAVTAALEGFKDARTHEAALTEINAAVEAGDFDGARAMVEDVRENAPDLDLNPDQARRLEAAGRSVIARGEQARRRARIEADRARARTQGTTYMELQRRMAGGEEITLEEVDNLRAEERLSDGQAGSLYGTIGSRVAREKAESFRENSAKLVTDFNTRKASFPDLMARKDELTTSDWLKVREANYRHWAKRADLKAKAGTERLTSRWTGALDRGEPLGDPETYAKLMWQASDNGAITPSTARSRIESYRNAYGGLVEDQRVTRSMLTQINQGAVVGKDERNRFEEVFATELNPLEAGPEVTTTAVSRAGYVPSGLKRRFETIDQVGREEAQVLLDTFQGIRAAKLNGSSEAMLQQELGADTFKKLDTLARLAPQAEDWNQTLKLANEAAKPDGSYSRKLQEVMQAEDADAARANLREGAREMVNTEIGRANYSAWNPRGWMNALADMVWDPYDPRATAFLNEAESYGLDLEGQELPEHVLDDVAKNAESLIGTGLARTPQAAVRRGLAMSLKTYGPERVGDEVRWSRNPISWHANRTNQMVPGFEVAATELQQDFRFQMRSAGKAAPQGQNWDDIQLRFDPVPGADDEWQVLYEDPEYAGEWHPLTYKGDDDEVGVTYSYEWMDADNNPVSLHAELYQAALEGKEGNVLAAPISELGVKFLTRWAANIDVQRAIDARRSRREWQRFWNDPTMQETKERNDARRERLQRAQDALIKALAGEEAE